LCPAADPKVKIEKYLLPSFDEIKRDGEAAAIISKRRNCWRKFEFRAAYITLCINHPELGQDLIKFRDEILHYLYNNYEFLPLMEKDIIWSVCHGYRIVILRK
jgi:hypothetical protein